MKKLIFVALLVVSSAAFANNYHNSNSRHHKNHNNCYNNLNLTDSQRREIRNYRLDIQEKQLKVSRLLNSEKIDWNEVENLNKEIAISKAKLDTEMLKLRTAQNNATTLTTK